MKIKKLSKICYEIETKHNLIYITKEKNLNTKNLYIYKKFYIRLQCPNHINLSLKIYRALIFHL